MKRSNLIAAALVLAFATSAAVTAAEAPQTWDGLTLIPKTKLAYVYLRPDADFCPYTKVKVDPTEVTLEKNWVRDYNSSRTDLSGRLDSKDIKTITDTARKGFEDIVAKSLTAKGYHVVKESGSDVLEVRTGLIDLKITAPDKQTASRSSSFSVDAGAVTLVIEARDSMTGAILGRALDRQVAGDNFAQRRTSVSNRADFELLFKRWADRAAAGLDTLKAQSGKCKGAKS